MYTVMIREHAVRGNSRLCSLHGTADSSVLHAKVDTAMLPPSCILKCIIDLVIYVARTIGQRPLPVSHCTGP